MQIEQVVAVEPERRDGGAERVLGCVAATFAGEREVDLGGRRRIASAAPRRGR